MVFDAPKVLLMWALRLCGLCALSAAFTELSFRRLLGSHCLHHYDVVHASCHVSYGWLQSIFDGEWGHVKGGHGMPYRGSMMGLLWACQMLLAIAHVALYSLLF